MRNAFQYPVTSRARDVFYKSPPAPGDIATYYNTPQSATAFCPGNTGEATAEVPAGWFSSVVSQEDANNKAAEYVQIVAQSKLLCGTIKCSTREGTAQLIGYAEFIDESQPPRFYRRAFNGGGWSGSLYYSSTCDGPATHHDSCSYTGFCQYDKVTGALATGGASQCFIAEVPGTPVPGCVDFTEEVCSSIFSVTKTRKELNSTSNCCYAGSDLFRRQDVPDAYFYQLADEDLETDAIARLFPDPDAGWSDYLSPDVDGCCAARIENRGSGQRVFAVREVRFECTVENLLPGSVHSVPVDLMRRVDQSADPFVKYATIEIPGTADSTGKLVVFGSVINSPGYETFAKFGGNDTGICSEGG